MIKVMVFIDGTWLYLNTPKLATEYEQEFHIDYGLLPKVLGKKVCEYMGIPDVDIVRTHLFGSIAANYNVLDEDSVQRRQDFFDRLREEYNYEIDLFPINFHGRRLKKKDRPAGDDFEPKEKCVDIALATSLLYNGAMPHAYDIAIVVVGDRDYVPVLQSVRKLGKRIAIASIKNSCAPEYADPLDAKRVKDTTIIWLNDIIPEIELKYERRQLECQSPLHVGLKKVWTTFRPRRGMPFFCDDCRRRFSESKASIPREYIAPLPVAEGAVAADEDDMLVSLDKEAADLASAVIGEVCDKKIEKGYGFINADNGKQYFFHLSDLEDIRWDIVDIGSRVMFNVKKEPFESKAGAAGRVRSVPENKK